MFSETKADNKAQRTVHYLKDYTPASFSINAVTLDFDLIANKTLVEATLEVVNNNHVVEDLVLNGESLALLSVELDGKQLQNDAFLLHEDGLTIYSVPCRCTVKTRVVISPANNKSLNGLYLSNGSFTTQCEPHGFRRITYFLDRPDVLTTFKCRITADKDQYPLLLSNGNLIDSGVHDDGRHWAQWHDPSLKPCYLFALVAGNFDVVSDTFVTKSGREVILKVYVEHGKGSQAHFALYSLKEAMRWDEEVYQREYDLDIYMIVAVSDFNFGAMENKGLNIFNDQYVLADPKLATDLDYTNILGVVGHEYFHNWSGNRVTCRDWFQLSLKEGLTIFRDQNFTADMTSNVAKRLGDVAMMQNYQFVEDAGPMSHPIRPESYVAMNNFYTATVYNKGAEVIRMLKRIVGDSAFKQGIQDYFAKYDGQAVTTDDFVTCIACASDIDLTQFRLWYSQKGTPTIRIKTQFDAHNAIFTVCLEQFIETDTDAPALHIPLCFALLDPDSGKALSINTTHPNIQRVDDQYVLNCTEKTMKICFDGFKRKPILSVLREFSAPVIIDFNREESENLHILKYDEDLINKWQVAHALLYIYILECYTAFKEDKSYALPQAFIDALSHCLHKSKVDGAFFEFLFTFPPIKRLFLRWPGLDISVLDTAYRYLEKQIANKLKADFITLYEKNPPQYPYVFAPDVVSSRAKRNLALRFISLSDDDTASKMVEVHYNNADNMTDKIGALTAVLFCEEPSKTRLLNDFLKCYRNHALVVDKWFRIQAQDTTTGAVDRIKSLLEHPLYDRHNPNRVRALLFTFASKNIAAFHADDEQGYALLATEIAAADKFNPQLAARLCEPFIGWRQLDKARQTGMKKYLHLLLSEDQISDDLFELVSKSLGTTDT